MLLAALLAVAVTMSATPVNAYTPKMKSSTDSQTCSWRVLACSTTTAAVAGDNATTTTTATAACLLTDAEFCTCCLSKALRQSTRTVGPVGGAPCPTECNEVGMYGAWCPWTAWSACGISIANSRRYRDCACPAPFMQPSELLDGRSGCPAETAEEVAACSAIFNSEVGVMLAVFLGGTCIAAVPIGVFLCYIRHRLDHGGGGVGGDNHLLAMPPHPLQQPPLGAPQQPESPPPPSPPQKPPVQSLESDPRPRRASKQQQLRLERYDRSPLHSSSCDSLDRLA